MIFGLFCIDILSRLPSSASAGRGRLFGARYQRRHRVLRDFAD